MFCCSAKWNRSISRILSSDLKSEIGVAIIHLVQLLPDWIKRSTRRSYPDESGFGRAALLTPPYLILHCEEFAWPHVSPHTPVRSYIKPLRAAPFHPSPSFEVSNLRSEIELGWFAFCCTCRHPESQISNLKSKILDAPPLAGSLPCSVRTFLSWTETQA